MVKWVWNRIREIEERHGKLFLFELAEDGSRIAQNLIKERDRMPGATCLNCGKTGELENGYCPNCRRS